MSLQALIFDLDGTLVDTMPLHWRAWQPILQRHSLNFSEARFYALGGVPSRDIIALLGREQGKALDALAIAKEKENAYLALLTEVKTIEPVLDLARSHRGKVALAIATGGTRRVVARVLQILGIEDWFKAVVTSEDVVRQKPAPDIFLEAARRVGAAPNHCRAFEDTDLGLTAIRAAGMEAVDVRRLLTGRFEQNALLAAHRS
jgi:beta-phosphoglucomutase family hydrolase